MPAYIGIISEKTHFDLKKDPDFVPVSEYANPDAQLGPWEVGKLDEVRFILAGSNAGYSSGGGAGSIDVHYTLIMGQEYFGITRVTGKAVEVIAKELGSSGVTDALNQRASMGWKATFVAKRLQEAFCVRIEHAVSS